MNDAGAEPDPHAVRTLLARRRKVRSHRGPVTSQHAKHQTPNTTMGCFAHEHMPSKVLAITGAISIVRIPPACPAFSPIFVSPHVEPHTLCSSVFAAPGAAGLLALAADRRGGRPGGRRHHPWPDLSAVGHRRGSARGRWWHEGRAFICFASHASIARCGRQTAVADQWVRLRVYSLVAAAKVS